MNSFCLAADNPVEREHKDHHHAGQEGKNLELSGKVENGIRVIEVKASQYKFEPDPIIVRLGEKVRLVVTSIDVAHGLAIPEFNINLPVAAGKIESLEFIADKKGLFHVHCSVYCGSGHAHMHASFIVQ
jgi:cytochrome c oxidase subunit 2